MSAALYLCLHLRDFAAQALEYAQPELRRRPLAILSGTAPLEYVFAVNQQARELGVERGMGRIQAESFALQHRVEGKTGSRGLAICRRDRAQEDRAFAHLIQCAKRFSPRIELIAAPRGPPGAPSVSGPGEEQSCDATLVLDIASSSRLLGTAEQIARAVEREVGSANSTAGGFKTSIAISCNAYTAVLAARGNAGITLVPPGSEAQTLASLPLAVLQQDEERGPRRGWLSGVEAQTLDAWGIRTLGQLAALPSRSLAARLGQSGLRLQAQARGEYNHLLVPTEEPADAPLCAGIELDHPAELLEPLLFLVNQLLQQILEPAQQRAQAIASLEFCLLLDKNAAGKNVSDEGAPYLPSFGRCGMEEHRTIRPALPERDRLVLLKLIQLELELRPPASAVAALRLVAHPARPQTAQQGLFAAQAPEPGRMAILLARLRKLVGEGRSGSPELLDSRAPEAFRMAAFDLTHSDEGRQNTVPAGALFKPSVGLSGAVAPPHPSPALRMLRPPREVAVELCRGAPVAIRFTPERQQRARCESHEWQRRTVQASSGPWRTSGEWWTHPAWCREEWEIVLHRDAMQEETLRNATFQNETFHGDTLRLAHDPANDEWYVIGIYD